jgi:hypothetical protein
MPTGARFGLLTILAFSHTDRRGGARYAAICDCGTRTTARGDSLRRGRTRSCGHLRRARARALAPIANRASVALRRAARKSVVSSETTASKIGRNPHDRSHQTNRRAVLALRALPEGAAQPRGTARDPKATRQVNIRDLTTNLQRTAATLTAHTKAADRYTRDLSPASDSLLWDHAGDSVTALSELGAKAAGIAADTAAAFDLIAFTMAPAAARDGFTSALDALQTAMEASARTLLSAMSLPWPADQITSSAPPSAIH